MLTFDERIGGILNNNNLPNVWKTKLKESNNPIVLFGAGAAGHFFAEKLIAWGIYPTCFCDNNLEGMDDKYDIPIISFEVLCRDFKDAYIFTSVSDTAAEAVKTQLKIAGFMEEQLVSRIFLEDKISREVFISNLERYRSLLAKLEDEKSQEVVYEKLKYFLDYFDIQLSSPQNDQYFENDIIQLGTTEVFVDGGGYTGDTLIEFVKRIQGKYKKIFSFEPDLSSFEKLSKASSDMDGVVLLNLGLWQNKDELLFQGNNWSQSRISKYGSKRINVVAIDDFFEEYPDDIPTFIKLDIEGAEMQALRGASKIIKQYKPKLAIAIYHKTNDIFEIPELILQLNSSYKLYIRQYSKSNGEMICYAI